MRDYKSYSDWEYECYKGRRRDPYRMWYALVTIVWALLVGILLVSSASSEDEPVVDVEETKEVHTETVKLITLEENDAAEEPDEQVEEPADQIDLTKLKQMENATVTAYCICKRCCGKDESHPAYGITASGRPAEPFVSVAVDPIRIELGSTVYVDYGDGDLREFRADDVGGGVNGAHIDVCYPDHQSALEHGVKTAKVYWKEGAQ